MQFHIDGRYQAEIRRENEAWTVARTEPGTRARLDEAIIAADLDEDDTACFLDTLFQEAFDDAP